MNQKNTQILLVILYLLLLVIGLILILQRLKLGLNSAERDLINVGGFAGDEYKLRQESYIESYRWIGIILLSSGLLGMIFKVNVAVIINEWVGIKE